MTTKDKVMRVVNFGYRACFAGVFVTGFCFMAILSLFGYAYLKGGLSEARMDMMPMLTGWNGYMGYLWLGLFVGFIVTWTIRVAVYLPDRMRRKHDTES